MNERKLKKIHGNDVELAPDDSEDEKLTEQQALDQAKEEGIKFKDEWCVQDDPFAQPISVHETEKAANKARTGDQIVVQRRSQI